MRRVDIIQLDKKKSLQLLCRVSRGLQKQDGREANDKKETNQMDKTVKHTDNGGQTIGATRNNYSNNIHKSVSYTNYNDSFI